MKNIFKKKNYKFGVESFLLMHLNQYQLVLGSDLENYAKSEGLFNKNNPCNIYFILRRPKVTIDPESVKINGNKAKFNFIIHHQDNYSIVNLGCELKKAESELKFDTEYPYNLFTFSDKNQVLLGARPSTLLDSSQVEDNIDTPSLDYEVLYIGQAYGKDGKRTALDRLASHETVQKIYMHSLTQHPNSDIWIMLANFSQQSMLMMAGSALIKVSEENEKIENKKLDTIFQNEGLPITEKQKINFTEAALIKYFEPKYNIDFKDNFPSSRHKSYSECYSLDVKALSLELDTSDMIRKIYTSKTGRKHNHFEMFEFNSDEDRISLLDLIIGS